MAEPSAVTNNYSLDDALSLISQYESDGKNVPNYRYDSTHTASGLWQITDTNWKKLAPDLGIDLTSYPTAMSAPETVQKQVAGALYQAEGFAPWANYNPKLASAIGQAPEGLAPGGAVKNALTQQQWGGLGQQLAGVGDRVELGGNPLLPTAASTPAAVGSPDLAMPPPTQNLQSTLALISLLSAGTHKAIQVDYDPFRFTPGYTTKTGMRNASAG